MKLTTLLLVIALLQVSAKGFSQITVTETNAPAEIVMKAIEKQTGYVFIYDEAKVKLGIVNVSLHNASITQSLTQLLKDAPVTYQIVKKNIVLQPISITPILSVIPKSISMASHSVSGVVSDTSGVTLIGATVTISNTNFKTLTDENGKFIFFSVPIGKYSLIITYVGYKKFENEFEVSSGDVSLQHLTLHSENSTLKEVIVSNGYQVLPLERATGSYDLITNNLLNRSTSQDILSRINGVASGVLFDNSLSGSGNNTVGISIRGLSTIQSNATPLIVLDNFPYDGDINNINPNDIESVTILKDASAASIWGAQAGNGVIVLTSKRGHINQPLKIEFSSNLTLSQKPNLYYSRNFLDANDYINVEQQLFSNGFYTPYLNQPGYPVAISPVVDLLNQQQNGEINATNANNQINAFRKIDYRSDLSKYFYQSPTQQQYSLNLSGGSNKVSYLFSAGYDNDNAMQVGSNNKRVTLNSQNTFTVSKNLELTAGLNFTDNHSEVDNTLSQFLSGSQAAPLIGQPFPYTELSDSKGNPLPVINQYSSEFVSSAQSMGYLNWQFVPLQELREHDNVTNINNYDVRANTGMKYTIVSGLNIDIKYQYEKALNSSLQDANQQSYYTRNYINEFSTLDANGNVNGYNVPIGDILNYGYSNLTSQDLRLQTNYNKSWNINELSLIAGFEERDAKTVYNDYFEYGYNPNISSNGNVNTVTPFTINPFGGQVNIPSGLFNNITDNRFRSYFANGGYTYDGKYTFSGSARVDQSNLFGVNFNQKSQPLWSTGFKWDVDKEKFYDVTWLNLLKARITYGYSGNVNNTIYAYPVFSINSNQTAYGTYPIGQLLSPGDPGLMWEKAGQLNFAVDFGILRNRINGSFEYYLKRGTDLVGTSPLPTSTGVSFNTGNYSDMDGKGVDLKINSINLDGKIRWETQLLISFNKNTVTKYLGEDGAESTIVIGKPVGALFALKSAGLDPLNGNPRGFLNGQISEDYSALVSQPITNSGNLFNSNSSWTYVGSSTPTSFGSILNSFSYKSLNLSANIIYKGGYYFRKTSINYYALFNQGIGNEDFAKRWQKPGDEKITDVPSMPDLNNVDPNRDAFYGSSQSQFDNGDQIRLQDINLSYSFAKSTYHQLPFNYIRVFIYANNLGILWRANKDGLDPDYGSIGIPQPRTISLGLKIGL